MKTCSTNMCDKTDNKESQAPILTIMALLHFLKVKRCGALLPGILGPDKVRGNWGTGSCQPETYFTRIKDTSLLVFEYPRLTGWCSEWRGREPQTSHKCPPFLHNRHV